MVIIILKQGNYLFRMHLECFKAIGLFIIQASFYLHGYYYYFALKKRENGILKLVKETISLVIQYLSMCLGHGKDLTTTLHVNQPFDV